MFADFRNQTVLIYGGGDAALCKVRLFLKTEASVNLVATSLNEELRQYLASGQIAWLESTFRPRQLNDVACVVCADSSDINAEVAKAAMARNIPVNVVDEPELSSFIMPAIIDRDPVVVAIGTEGTGPSARSAAYVVGCRRRASIHDCSAAAL